LVRREGREVNCKRIHGLTPVQVAQRVGPFVVAYGIEELTPLGADIRD
jgi:hypothetical protein